MMLVVSLGDVGFGSAVSGFHMILFFLSHAQGICFLATKTLHLSAPPAQTGLPTPPVERPRLPGCPGVTPARSELVQNSLSPADQAIWDSVMREHRKKRRRSRQFGSDKERAAFLVEEELQVVVASLVN